MSLVVLVVDTDEMLLEYSVAGHPFPFLVRGGNIVGLEGKGGLLLALPFLVTGGYQRHQIELQHGDQLVLFTDGLLEVPVNDEGSQLGRAGLANLVTSVLAAGGAGRVGRLVAEVSARDSNGQADDDRTALLVELSSLGAGTIPADRP